MPASVALCALCGETFGPKTAAKVIDRRGGEEVYFLNPRS